MRFPQLQKRAPFNHVAVWAEDTGRVLDGRLPLQFEFALTILDNNDPDERDRMMLSINVPWPDGYPASTPLRDVSPNYIGLTRLDIIGTRITLGVYESAPRRFSDRSTAGEREAMRGVPLAALRRGLEVLHTMDTIQMPLNARVSAVVTADIADDVVPLEQIPWATSTEDIISHLMDYGADLAWPQLPRGVLDAGSVAGIRGETAVLLSKVYKTERLVDYYVGIGFEVRYLNGGESANIVSSLGRLLQKGGGGGGGGEAGEGEWFD